MKCCEVDEKRQPMAGTEFVIRADLAFIAIGFAGPSRTGVLNELGERLKTAKDSRRSTNVRPTITTTAPASTGSTPPETCGAASRWWSGRSAKAGRPRARSTWP